MATTSHTLNSESIIQHFGLIPHPEGGYFKETYRSEGLIHSGGWADDRPRHYSTCIYYLLDKARPSSGLHRLTHDEIWHFYNGSPVKLWMFHPKEKRVESVIVGPDLLNGQVVQQVIPAGCWFGGHLIDPECYALFGCTVAPGFDFADFELADIASLKTQYPDYNTVVDQLTAQPV